MRLELEKRERPSGLMALLSPGLALLLTVLISATIFTSLGKHPGEGLFFLFVEPMTDWYLIGQVLVKLAPLALIAAGLCLCFAANVWNIGAEGQYLVGAIFGAAVPILVPQVEGLWVLPLMILLGCLGGALYALIPAILRVRFNTNEILVSLMLVYVAVLFLDWLVRGPWRDPNGRNNPGSIRFPESARMPEVGPLDGTLAMLLVALIALLLTLMVRRSYLGFSFRLSGAAPRAAGFAGVPRPRVVVVVMALSGGLAGMAGILEAAGPIGALTEKLPTDYGFTAIIIAFLGRLNPAGAVVAALVLSVTFVGGEGAQMMMQVSDKLSDVLQGLLLFLVLACDVLIRHRLRLRPGQPGPASGPALGSTTGPALGPETKTAAAGPAPRGSARAAPGAAAGRPAEGPA